MAKKMTFTKNGAVKRTKSAQLAEILVADGWELEGKRSPKPADEPKPTKEK